MRRISSIRPLRRAALDVDNLGDAAASRLDTPPVSAPRSTPIPALTTGLLLLLLLVACEGRSDSPASPSALPGSSGGGPAGVSTLAEEGPSPSHEPPPPGVRIITVTFDGAPLGDYTRTAFSRDWPRYRWVDGLGSGRAEIVGAPSAYSGRSLRLKYPRDTYGPADQAMQFWVDLPRSFEGLYLSYRVRFEDGFDFVRGGKLPGLLGGTGNTGGVRPTGLDGWSGRMMWSFGGAAVQYLYHPDQPGIYGEYLSWNRTFQPGRWYTVEHRFVMNTPGTRDGIVQTWLDGSEALHLSNLRFRDAATFAIDGFLFSTFFGGDDATWAPSKDEYAYFDDFVIATGHIGQ